MTKRKMNKLVATVLVLIMLAATTITSFAQTEPENFTDSISELAPPIEMVYQKQEVGEVIFTDLDDEPNQSYEGIDSLGNPYTITVETIERPNLSSLSFQSSGIELAHLVSFFGLT